MNRNSKLCCYMTEHERWKEELASLYKIHVKESGSYAILNYDEFSDFSNPLVQEARGIIIDTESLEVVCWSFNKFGNFNESYADKIDWSTARVQEKIDGSIIKLWYGKREGNWNFSTNGMIDAAEACVGEEVNGSYLDVIHKADNFEDIPFDSLDKELTCIFELVSPQTQVVVKYDKVHLYHIGTRNVRTGQELQVDIGIEKPREYSLRSLEECKQAAAALNRAGDGMLHGVQKEGFVVVDAGWRRNKVKSAEYCMLAHLVSCTKASKDYLLDLMRNGKFDTEGMARSCPNLAHYFKYYDYKVAELAYQADVFVDLTRRLYQESGYDRKAVALRIQKHRLAPIGFLALKLEQRGREILASQPIRAYSKYIPDYKPERLGSVFYDKVDTAWELQDAESEGGKV